MNKFWKTKHQLRTLLFLKWWSVILFSSPKLHLYFWISWPFSHIPFPGKKIPFFSSKNYRFLFSSLWLYISNYPALYTYAKISQAGTAQLLCRLPKTVNWEEKGSWNRSLQECCAVMDMGDMVRMSVTIGHWEEKRVLLSNWKHLQEWLEKYCFNDF